MFICTECAPTNIASRMLTFMRTTYYSVGAVRNRLFRLRQSLLISIASKVDRSVIYCILSNKKKKRSDLRHWRRRQRQVKAVYFNINIFSTEESLRLFHFRPEELKQVCSIVSFSGITKRRRYRCDPLIESCVMIRRLAFPCPWFDL